jgi:hypothetical protein
VMLLTVMLLTDTLWPPAVIVSLDWSLSPVCTQVRLVGRCGMIIRVQIPAVVRPDPAQSSTVRALLSRPTSMWEFRRPRLSERDSLRGPQIRDCRYRTLRPAAIHLEPTSRRGTVHTRRMALEEAMTRRMAALAGCQWVVSRLTGTSATSLITTARSISKAWR